MCANLFSLANNHVMVAEYRHVFKATNIQRVVLFLIKAVYTIGGWFLFVTPSVSVFETTAPHSSFVDLALPFVLGL